MSKFIDNSVQGEAVVHVINDDDKFIGNITRKNDDKWLYTPLPNTSLDVNDVGTVLWFFDNCGDMYKFEFFDRYKGIPTQEWKVKIEKFFNDE